MVHNLLFLITAVATQSNPSSALKTIIVSYSGSTFLVYAHVRSASSFLLLLLLLIVIPEVVK